MRPTRRGSAIMKVFPALLLLTTIFLLGACDRSAPVESAKTSSPATPAGVAGEGLDARQFLGRASKVVKENPVKPDWPYIVVEGANLNLSAHPVDAQEATLIQAPLAAGAYQLKSSALLSPTSEFPIEFTIDLLQNGKPARLMSKTFKPNGAVELDQAIQVPAGPAELALAVKMAPEAKNHYGATLYLRDFKLGRPAPKN